MQMTREEAYLAQADQKAWDAYHKAVSDSAYPHWDYVVVTASNAQQAVGFRKQLQQRKNAGFLPPSTHFGVVPDPVGERVGNGGAMLGAMRYVAEMAGRTDFSGLRILVLLSSGDSKRVAQYSAMGKVFSPVPRELPDGRLSMLFDELMIAMAGVAEKISSGMLVLSGDVLLAFDAEQIPSLGEEAAAIAFPEPVQTGADHGVFLRDENGYIDKVWHKQKEASLRSFGAVDDRGYVDIDTGAVFFPPKVIEALYRLICEESGACTQQSFHRYVNGRIALSLYVDFFYPLAGASTYAGYLKEIPEGIMCPELLEARERLWKILHPFRIRLLRLTPSRFIHFGSTPDVLQLMSVGIAEYAYLGWQRQVGGSVNRQDVAAYNSTIAKNVICGERVYLENSIVGEGCTIGSGTILSSIPIRDACVPENVVLHGLRQQNGKYVARIYGVYDNPKAVLEGDATLFSRSLREFLSDRAISVSDIWSQDDHSLWTANLYAECDTMREAVMAALRLYRIVQGDENADVWIKTTRKSLCSSFYDADGTIWVCEDAL